MIPLHVLTGFLGSGKTTVLSALLQGATSERIAVIVNEVGELAIDQHLLERVDDDLAVLPSGCICCALRSELVATILRVAALRPSRIVLETSGLADPAPILHLLAVDPQLRAAVALAGVVVVADALRLDALLRAQPEVQRQLEFADRIVLTKVDLLPERTAAAHELLREAAPGCAVVESVGGRVDADWLLAPAPLARLRRADDAQRWLRHGGKGAAFRTHAIELPQPCAVDLVQQWLRMVTMLDGPRLLRVKGIVESRTDGGMWALQSAGHAVSPPRQLSVRPTNVRGVQMVLIERGMPPSAMAQVDAALRQAVAATPAR